MNKRGRISSVIVLLVPILIGCAKFEETGTLYTTEEWLTDEDELKFPFDLKEAKFDSTDNSGFKVPEEALKAATTESLLQAVKQYAAHFSHYGFYNFPSYYMIFVSDNFNAVSELQSRADWAETLLATYEGEVFMPSRDIGKKEDQEEYDRERSVLENQIVLEEIFLATDLIFEQADEEMRQQIIEAAMKKEEQRLRYEDTTDHPSGFFACITELQDTIGSSWYTYIMDEHQDEIVKAHLEEYGNVLYWPRKSANTGMSSEETYSD